MRVSLEISGGFTGLRQSSAMDTDELPPEHLDGVLGALGTLGDAATSGPPGAASQPIYRLAVSAPAGERVLELTESQIPDGLRPLIEELRRRAHPS
ncbi:MAG: protealysin inhibitor emfourin [Specibacter sp.]